MYSITYGLRIASVCGSLVLLTDAHHLPWRARRILLPLLTTTPVPLLQHRCTPPFAPARTIFFVARRLLPIPVLLAELRYPPLAPPIPYLPLPLFIFPCCTCTHGWTTFAFCRATRAARCRPSPVARCRRGFIINMPVLWWQPGIYLRFVMRTFYLHYARFAHVIVVAQRFFFTRYVLYHSASRQQRSRLHYLDLARFAPCLYSLPLYGFTCVPAFLPCICVYLRTTCYADGWFTTASYLPPPTVYLLRKHTYHHRTPTPLPATYRAHATALCRWFGS